MCHLLIAVMTKTGYRPTNQSTRERERERESESERERERDRDRDRQTDRQTDIYIQTVSTKERFSQKINGLCSKLRG